LAEAALGLQSFVRCWRANPGPRASTVPLSYTLALGSPSQRACSTRLWGESLHLRDTFRVQSGLCASLVCPVTLRSQFEAPQCLQPLAHFVPVFEGFLEFLLLLSCLPRKVSFCLAFLSSAPTHSRVQACGDLHAVNSRSRGTDRSGGTSAF
jgi:hypothetical protein